MSSIGGGWIYSGIAQYILTAAPSLGSQDYLSLLVYYSAKTSRYRQNGLSYVLKKILTWMLRQARGDLKATVGNRVLPITLSI